MRWLRCVRIALATGLPVRSAFAFDGAAVPPPAVAHDYVRSCAKRKRLVRAAGLEPARGNPDGFSYHFDLRRRPGTNLGVRGLDYPFTMP